MITIYTKPNCQPCRMTKKYLTENHIDFTEINGLEHIDQLKDEGFASFPVIKTETDSWAGFNPTKLKTLN